LVAGDPDPVAPRGERAEPLPVRSRQRFGAGVVVEAVAEADDARRREGGDLGGQPAERLGGLVRRQQAAAAAGQPLGTAEMQVGDAEQALVGPPEGAGGACGQARAEEGQRPAGGAGVRCGLRDRS
jgi:hypothetical protein